MPDQLLEISDLHVHFPQPGLRRKPVQVINGVSLSIKRGETVSLVGESGSGKTTIGRAVLGLAPVTAGTITFDGQTISNLPRRQRRPLTRGIQVIFQDPYSSLNPAMTIEDILVEPLRARGMLGVDGVKGGRTKVRDLLDAVHLPADAGSRYSREFSGGQRQRIAIARALALDPTLIVCDEPTSALDMTTQDRVLTLLSEIQQRTGVSYLFISHDLAVVHRMSDRVAVLLRGEIVETGPADVIINRPEHPYTQRLQMATPVPDPVRQQRRREDRRTLLDAQSHESSESA
ncbi:ATP-binding cassette domain-containing protein [Microlunatus sp. GCM10028923]|uniref:ATP-binding cassette domain-containing protein n=1 Tax=Microlunatus sp. GCM10028923 TaxID=3273400 RepID=UPI003618AA34